VNRQVEQVEGRVPDRVGQEPLVANEDQRDENARHHLHDGVRDKPPRGDEARTPAPPRETPRFDGEERERNERARSHGGGEEVER
jgi:hypothetical protein